MFGAFDELRNGARRCDVCAIAGYSTLAGGKRPVDPEIVQRMIEAVLHRGPDQRGVAAVRHTVLASARLAIMDIEGGRQPITNEDDSITVICNGEIYNAPELRQHLITKGHSFKTHSDTEVLVHLYEEEGLSFLSRLNGMFALALYDHGRERLVLARDRFGVKPLVYMRCGDTLIFASEIKALVKHPSFDQTLSPEGLAVFLGLFYIPDPWTAYRQVSKLEPGHYIVLSKSGFEKSAYHHLQLGRKNGANRVEAERHTVELLGQSVARQLMSDVPVGVLLSGGLDSRSILSLTTQSIPGVPSFTIAFTEEDFDEGNSARKWAELFGSDHRAMIFDVDAFCDSYLARQRHLDEPYGLWCNVASAALGAFVNDTGIKVVLGGDGGDELFLGYPTIHAAQVARLYRLLPKVFRNGVVAPFVRGLPAGSGPLPFSFKLKSFVEADDRDPLRTFFGFKEVIRYRDWPTLLTPEALQLVGDHDPYIAFAQHLPNIEELHPIDAMSYLDFKVFLPGCSLTGLDNAYMENSVELRVPFLDNDLVNFACGLEPDVRFHPFKTKPILRRALRHRLLGEHDRRHRQEIGRYSKAGFEVPGEVWLRNARFEGIIRDMLSPERIERTGFFRPAAVQHVLDDQMRGRQNNERMIQAMASLTMFLDR